MSRLTPWLGAALGALAVAPAGARAETWVVPDDFVTIQAAVDFAETGDVVLVRRGTYIENILVAGKSIRIASIDGPEVTVIDGGAPTRPDTLSVFCAIAAEELELEGFTLQSGLGGSSLGEGSRAASGGGILLFASGGRVQNCVVFANECEGDGGGIYVYLSTALAIEGCSVRGNRCQVNGGGIAIHNSSPALLDCVIQDNRSSTGCGIATIGVSSAVMERLVVAGNRNDTGVVGAGGGVFIDRGTPRLESCTIVRNGNDLGAGIHVSLANRLQLSRTIVAFNEPGAGLTCAGGFLEVACSDIFGNAGGDGLCGTDLGGNFALDPLLCQDLTIARESPCAPEHSPAGCGLVGALGVGCGAPVAPATWGRIKAGRGFR